MQQRELRLRLSFKMNWLISAFALSSPTSQTSPSATHRTLSHLPTLKLAIPRGHYFGCSTSHQRSKALKHAIKQVGRRRKNEDRPSQLPWPSSEDILEHRERRRRVSLLFSYPTLLSGHYHFILRQQHNILMALMFQGAAGGAEESQTLLCA